MDMNYTVVETSKLAAVRGGGHNYSLIADVDVENGHLGFVGDLAEDVGGLETYEFEVPTTALIAAKRPVLVAHPEWDYDGCRRTNQAMYNYINKAGQIFRAYDLIAGDVYAVTAGGINAGTTTTGEGADAVTTPNEIEIGKYVILENGKTTAKMVEKSATTGKGFVGQIIGKARRGLGWTTKNNAVVVGRPYVVYFIRILRNDIA